MPEQLTSVTDISFNMHVMLKSLVLIRDLKKSKKLMSQEKLGKHIIPGINELFSIQHPARINIPEICSNLLVVLIFASLIEQSQAGWQVTGYFGRRFIKVC